MSFAFDAMHGVAGPYARAVFEEALGVDGGCLRNCEPKTDFGGARAMDSGGLGRGGSCGG
eukprot:1660977-Pleurochrysis_carterae.AAC.1